MPRHGGLHRRRAPRRPRRRLRRLGAWGLRLALAQTGSALCVALGVTAACVRLARAALALVGL